MGLKHILPLWVRVDLGVMAMKGHSTYLIAPGLEPHHLIWRRSYTSTEMQSMYSTPLLTGLESMREHHLWVRPYFSSHPPHVLFILFWWLVRLKSSSHITAVLWSAVSRIFQNGTQYSCGASIQQYLHSHGLKEVFFKQQVSRAS